MSVTSAPVATPTARMVGLLERLRVLSAGVGRADLADRLARARDRTADPRMRVIVTGETGQGATALTAALADAIGRAPQNTTAGPATRFPEHALGADGLLVLVDTPGVSGARSAAAGAALAEIARADAVLFVSDAGREYTASQLAHLEKIRALCPTVVGVVTRIDRYPRWADVQRADRTRLTDAGIDIPLLPVSARLHGTARRSGDDALAVESGVPQLADFLTERIVTGAAAVAHAGMVHDVRAVTDQIATGLDAELAVLRDPAGGAATQARLASARAAVTALADRTAGWRTVLDDGATELGATVDHDLRHRLRGLVREAETDIMTGDPAKRWETFGTWLDQRITEEVEANLVLAENRSRELAQRVAARFADDAALPELDLGSAGRFLDPVRDLEGLDSRKAGVVQRVISSMRGSYGGILMVGLASTLVGLALVNPWSIGAGVLLGANTFREDHKARTARRQAEAKTAVTRLVDDVLFQVGTASRHRLREVQRALRDHFTTLAAELARSADDAVRAAESARRLDDTRRTARIGEVEELLGELRTLRVQAATSLR